MFNIYFMIWWLTELFSFFHCFSLPLSLLVKWMLFFFFFVFRIKTPLKFCKIFPKKKNQRLKFIAKTKQKNRKNPKSWMILDDFSFLFFFQSIQSIHPPINQSKDIIIMMMMIIIIIIATLLTYLLNFFHCHCQCEKHKQRKKKKEEDLLINKEKTKCYFFFSLTHFSLCNDNDDLVM